MSDPKALRVVEQDLDDAEKAVVKALYEWLQSNPNVQWKISGRKNIEQCSDITAQRNITEPLSTRPFTITIFRTSFDGLRLNEPGYLIPIFPSTGCSVADGDVSHPLEYGKKLRIPTGTSIEISQGYLYILWLIG